ncbi:HPr kinase/phosphorylase [Caenispirillum salinarum]|nr:aldolase [Caenispirillum salinarum]
MTTRMHVTTVAVEGVGVLLRGPSGSGKSDLALRLIDAGATLVSDDYTDLYLRDGVLTAAAPEIIAGLMEVRGVGIVRLCPPTAPPAPVPVALLVDLVHDACAVERLPDPQAEALLPDHPVRRIVLDPFEASAPAKVRLAVRIVSDDSLSPQ